MPDNPIDPQETDNLPPVETNEKATFSISGTVFRHESLERMKFAVLTATRKRGKNEPEVGPVLSTTADDDGDFAFDGLDKGEWIINAFHKKSQFSKKINLDLQKDRKDIDIYMSPLSTDADTSAGWKFLLSSIGVLLALGVAYVFLHINLPRSQGPLDENILGTVQTMKKRVQKIASQNDSLQLGPTIAKLDLAVQKLPLANSLTKLYITPLKTKFEVGEVDSVKLILESMAKDSLLKGLSENVSFLTKAVQKYIQLKGDADLNTQQSRLDTTLKTVLKENKLLKTAYRDSLGGLLGKVEKARSQNNSVALIHQLSALEEGIQNPVITKVFSKWTEYPWLMLEVLLWALAGILVHKIIVVGSYLRFGSFYSRGIPMHLSHYFAVPLMVLVAMMLLSLVSFEFALESGQSVKIDFKYPYILAAFSFVLANQPWGILRFIHSSAKSITSSINKKNKTEHADDPKNSID